MTKSLVEIMGADRSHWVGDGFRVRTLFSYDGDTDAISPFLLLDYGDPHFFEPNTGSPRGVGQHPHRGFETVTIVYDGEVSHRDNHGGGGTIGPGDVQWMTAGSGVIHEEFHSKAYSEKGGPFRMIQLWVNLPKKNKMDPPRYQAILDAEIPAIGFDGGTARIIAGEFEGNKGPASTFSPMNIWDVKIPEAGDVSLDLPEGHNAMVVVLSGYVETDGKRISAARIGRFSVEGSGVNLKAAKDTRLLVLTGEPLGDPVVGHGPFVMTSVDEIRQAFVDFQSGRFGSMPE
ncbi:pirin family protein [Ponticaulis sp.]|uniref:pirin family protein n=1 Tax=Ponticaulis sp. TaxID=2020902 RepID=UPI000B6D36F4|nr:pirin family protein [Ponticaulis sp.]MAI90379.1 quercetin 2,3-dioxygenase [Ponticaulis sp.]OUY00082.1 MAG: quercetin 2,3-dioxygenase [Hyphomonadaceae bacterium TMED5]|tara:strand:- start:6185 stop:7048 length:864 start_codon:yes stop_codon:yes gene_type:complete